MSHYNPVVLFVLSSDVVTVFFDIKKDTKKKEHGCSSN